MVNIFAKQLKILFAVFLISLSTTAASAEQTLYERLGGYDAVSAVVDDVMGRLAADPQVGRVLEHIPDSRANHVAQLMKQFICAATGGPCKYIGKTMLESHKGMGLTESDWNKTVNHLQTTLNKFNVPEKEKQEVLATIGGLKSSIVDS